jgi:hypothetical protein
LWRGFSIHSRKGEESNYEGNFVLNSIEQEKWYSVKEVAAILGFSEDTVIRQINRGFLKAIVLLGHSDKRRRSYRCRRIQGAEIIRYIKIFMNRN